MNFKMSNIVPSWFLYPVGLISSSLAGSQFGHNLFSETLAIMCIGIYFFMLPLVLYRLVFLAHCQDEQDQRSRLWPRQLTCHWQLI